MTLTLTIHSECKMRRKYLGIFVAGLLAIGPAHAATDDSATLLITGNTGAVLTVENMTQRECNAAVGLLSARPSSSGNITVWGGSSISIGPTTSDPPKTPAVTSAKCVTPTAKP